MDEKAVVPAESSGVLLSRPLYEIADEYLALCDMIEARDEGPGEAELLAFDAIQGTVAEKLENCCVMVKALTVHGKVLKEEAASITARAKQFEDRRDGLKEYMLRQLIRMGIKKSEGRALNVRRQDNPPGCVVYDLEKVPAEYQDVTIKMTGVGWANLQAVLKTVIPDQTEGATAIDHWGGVWKVERKVRSQEIIDLWKACGGAEDVPGTTCSKGESLRIW